VVVGLGNKEKRGEPDKESEVARESWLVAKDE